MILPHWWDVGSALVGGALGCFVPSGGGVSCGGSRGKSAPLSAILVASASALATGGH
jgi:hypothetical protein